VDEGDDPERAMILALSMAWAGLVAAAWWSRRPSPARDLVAAAPVAPIPTRTLVRIREPRRALVAIAVIAVAAEPVLTVVGATVFAAIFAARRARQRQQRRDAMAAQVPDLADHLGMCLAGGLSPRTALLYLGPLLCEPLRSELSPLLRQVEHGDRLADRLTELAGPRHPLGLIARAMIDAERSGTPLGDLVARSAETARAELRRGLETRARRLPVLMLLPLSGCVLPAFVLLTVVPLLIATAGGIDLR
jgi:pilus assembly protein TadC